MPEYCFVCEKCNDKFSEFLPVSKCSEKPICSKCKSNKKVYRDYSSENKTLDIPKTVGSFLDRTSMSQDQKEHIKNKNKQEKI